MASKFINKIPPYVVKVTGRGDALLSLVAAEVYRISQMQVPYEKGTLQKSAAPGPQRIANEKYRVQYDTPYARRLHDDMSLHIKAPGRKQKYLEDPADFVARRFEGYAKVIFQR